MAQFQKLVTTLKGQALIAKMIAGQNDIAFTTVSTSSAVYSSQELESLSGIDDIKQTVLVSSVTRSNDTTIRIEGAVNNTELTESYKCSTIGIFCADPDEGEILYAVTVVDLTIENNVPDFIPAFNGLTVTGIKFDFLITVGNSENVTLEVDPAAVVTVSQLNAAVSAAVNSAVEEIKNELGTGGIGGVVFSKTRPENFTLWLRDFGEIPEPNTSEPSTSEETAVIINTAPLDTAGDFAVMNEDGSGETVLNMTDNPMTAKDDDIIVATT